MKRFFLLGAVTFLVLFWGLFSMVLPVEAGTWAKSYTPAWGDCPPNLGCYTGTSFIYSLRGEGFLVTANKLPDPYRTWIMKTDFQGEVEKKYFFGPQVGAPYFYSHLIGIYPDGRGNWWAGGTLEEDGARQFWFLRLKEDGTVLVSKVLGGNAADQAYAVKPGLRGLALTGISYSYNQRAGDIWLVEFGQNGGVLLQKEIGSYYHEEARDFLTLSDGYLLLGSIELSPPKGDLLLVRLNSQGDFLWARTFGTPADERGWKIVKHKNGYLLLGALTVTDNGGTVPLLVLVDYQGNILWQKKYTGTLFWGAPTLMATEDGGFVVGGVIFDETHKAGALFKVDSQGHILWHKGYHSVHWTIISALAPDGGDIIAGGSTDASAVQPDSSAFLMKVDGNTGNIQECSNTFRVNDIPLQEEPYALESSPFEMNTRNTSSEPRPLDVFLGQMPLQTHTFCENTGTPLWVEVEVETHCNIIAAAPWVRVTVSLGPPDQPGTGDYFLWARIPGGDCYCYFYPYVWNPCSCTDPSPAYQGPLYPLTNFEVFQSSCFALPAGDYTLYFAVDAQMNGLLDEDAARDEVQFSIGP